MYKKEKREIINCGIKLDRYGLITLSGGNVSCRMANGDVLVTPSGMIYEDMVDDDVLVVDLEGHVLEGERKVSVDTEALLYIFKNMPQVNAIIHTHQPYATALGLIQNQIDCNLTTLANATGGTVTVAPYSSAASLDMGIKTVENLNGKLATVLKHHGVLAVGNSLKQALYACVYLEEACKTILAAKASGQEMALMNEQQIQDAVDVFKIYGQEK